MKKKILYSIVVVISLVAVVGFVPLGTTQTGLTLVRADAGEDGSNISNAFSYLSQSDFGSKSATAWELPDTDSESAANAVKFYFTTDGDGKTFSAGCFAYSAINGPAQLVCTIACTGGKQRAMVFPNGTAASGRNWVDTITVIDRWPKAVSTGSSGAGNDIITVVFWDTMGDKFYKWYVWDADGSTGTEAGNVSTWGSYF